MIEDEESVGVKVHYKGYAKRHDETLPLDDGKVRWPVDGYDVSTAADRKRYKSAIGLAKSAKKGKSQYFVDMLLDKRTSVNGAVSYLVRWKDYGEEHDSWEPNKGFIGLNKAFKG